ncbi:MAG: hypothetical protein ACOCTG_02375 [Bacteroidota bacterium]
MARRSKVSSGEITFKELDADEARRIFSKKRGRGSKYDSVMEAAEKLSAGKALIVEQITYSEVTGIRMRLRDQLGDDFKIEATKTDREKNLYDLLIQRKG